MDEFDTESLNTSQLLRQNQYQFTNEIKLKKISYSDHLSSVGSDKRSSSHHSNRLSNKNDQEGGSEEHINNSIINDLDNTSISTIYGSGATSNNNNNQQQHQSHHTNFTLTLQQQQEFQQLQQQHRQQYQNIDSEYTPPNIYIYDPDFLNNDHQDNDNNNNNNDSTHKDNLNDSNIITKTSTELSGLNINETEIIETPNNIQTITKSTFSPETITTTTTTTTTNNNNNNKRKLDSSFDGSNNLKSTPLLMIPENENENKLMKQELLKELSKVESFLKITNPGDIFGFCECTLLYNHLSITNLIITSKYLIFLPPQQVSKDYVLENYLQKKGDFFWRKYWFVLTPDSISWYKTSVLKETHYPNGTILLSKIVTVDKMSPDETGKPLCLQIITNTQIHLIQFDTEPQMDHWYNEINRMQKNLKITISFNDIVSISMESNAALFSDSICLTLKKGENCLVTPISSSNEFYILFVKIWNRNRGLHILDSDKQKKMLEFQKTFKLTQGVNIITETPCTFYQDEEFSYDGILYATTDSLYFSSEDSVLIIPENDILAITIDRKAESNNSNRDSLKIYTTDYEILYFDNIDNIDSFYSTVTTPLKNGNPKIFLSSIGQTPPIQSINKEKQTGIRSWRIPLLANIPIPNFSIPIPIPKSIPIPFMKSKSTSSISEPHQHFNLDDASHINSNENNSLATITNNNQINKSTGIQSTSNSTVSPILLSNASPSTQSLQNKNNNINNSNNINNNNNNNVPDHEKTILIQKNSNINSKFHDIFPLLPLDETVIMYQHCTLYYYSYDSNVEGTVYITKSYIAFNPSPLSKQHPNHSPTSTYDSDSDDSDSDSDTDSTNSDTFDDFNGTTTTNVNNGLTNDKLKEREILMKKALIPFEEIVSITKEKFALLFNQCVKIHTNDHKWIFGSLNNLTGFYNLVLDTWKQIPLPENEGIFTPLETVKIKNKLGLPAEENLITWFNCTNFKGAQLKYGFLYISNNHICFRSKFGFQKRNIFIPFSQVIEIKKYSVLIPNGIKITTSGQQDFQFASFIHRNKVFQILTDTWLKSKKQQRGSGGSIVDGSSSSCQNTPILDSQPQHIDQIQPLSLQSQQQLTDQQNIENDKQQLSSTPPKINLQLPSIQQTSSSTLSSTSSTTSGSNILLSPRSAQSLTSPSLTSPPLNSNTPNIQSPTLPIRSLRITILTIGSRGDVQPYIALALGLKEYGHQVTLASHELYRDWINDYGLIYKPLGGDPKELMDLCVRNGIFTPKFIKEALHRFRSFIDNLLLTCWEASQNAEVLIATPGCFAGPHIAEALQIPFFNSFTMPFTRTRVYPNPFAPFASHQMGGVFNLATHIMMEKILWQPISGQINQWRTETLKIPAWNSSVSINETIRMPYLYCFSKYLVPKPSDWSGEIDISGYWILKNSQHDEQASQELLDFINADINDPPIYIGFGSIVIENPNALSSLLVEAIKLSGKRAIISQGWGGLSLDEKSNVENLLENQSTSTQQQSTASKIYLLKQPIDHSWLFKKVSLVIHHGGAGTTAAGLYASKPTIIIPFFGDQFFWGERIKETGIGTSISFDQLTAKQLSSTIISILNDTSINGRVAKISKLLEKEDGIQEAISFIHRHLPFSFIPPRELPFSSAPNSCMHCKQPFSLLHVMKPRAHCHNCGKIFCENCANHKIPIRKYRINTPVRVCNPCYNQIQSTQNINPFIVQND